MVQLLYDAAYTAVALLALYIAVEIFTQVRLDLTFGPCKVCTDTVEYSYSPNSVPVVA